MKKYNSLSTQTFSACILSIFVLWGCEERPLEDDVSSALYKVEGEYRNANNSEPPSVAEVHTSFSKNETVANQEWVERTHREIKRATAEYVANKKVYNKTGRIDFEGYDVGVFPMSGSCPTGYEKLVIYMDCENNNPFTRIEKRAGQFSIQSGVVVEGRNVKWVICRVDGRKFKPFADVNGRNVPFGVVSLGNLASGAYTTKSLERYFDNEDVGIGSNQNYSEGDIGPNISNQNTYMRFRVIEPSASTVDKTGAGFKGVPTDVLNYDTYGVLANGYTTIQGYTVQPGFYLSIDDEDYRNANWAKLDNSVYYNGTYSWFIANTNTYFNIVFP